MLDLKNQFIMAPVKLGYANKDGMVNDRHIKFYDRRSGHIAAIALEPLYLHSGLREIPTQLGIDNDDKIEGLKKLTDAIHTSGAKVIAHLNHPGRMANPQIPGNFWVSSTDRPCENGGASPQAMDEDDMSQARDLFVDAAVRAQKSGIDIIELQMGHGYLLGQFLSPAVNDRDDEYGGDFEGRALFPLSVLDAVRDAVSLPIIVRLSAEEMTPNGIKIDETIKLVELLESRGVDAVHISAGTICNTPPWYFQHMFVPKGKTWQFASEIKKHTSLPVISVGQIDTPQDLQKLEDLHIDHIAIGRGLVADPDLVGKLMGTIDEEIRPCMACSDGCLGGVRSGKGLGCVINPEVGNELPPLQKATKSKRFAIIGAGPAGMEAALTLDERGHDVDLFEKDELGGQVILASIPPHKQSLESIVAYYKRRLDNSGVNFINKEAEAEDMLRDYDTAVLATGSRPFIPPIPGLDRYSWAESLMDEELRDKHILIIGGGLIGIEVSSKLIEQNNRVTIVEMLDEIARGMEMIERTVTLKKLSAHNVEILTSHKVTSIENDIVHLEGEQKQRIEGVDHIVIATGMQSYNPLQSQLEGEIETVCIGDARQVGKIQDAIRDARVTALGL